MTAIEDLLGAFEVHSPEQIRDALRRGADPVAPVGGKAPLSWLIEMYPRSSRFAACLREMFEAGAELGDRYLEALLLDDGPLLRSALEGSEGDLERRFDLECAYTSLHGVSALHLCAEYGSIECARVLLELGLDVDVRAEVDRDGLGGQTPLFHTVNSNRNHCRPLMELLVESGAAVDVRLRGLRWGAGCDWETVVFDCTPITYAQCGLYPQFHRLEEHVHSNVDYLYRRRFGVAAPRHNVPNRYVSEGFDLDAARRGQGAPDVKDP